MGQLAPTSPIIIRGSLIEVRGPRLHVRLPSATIGDYLAVTRTDSTDPLIAQVVALSETHAIATPLGATTALRIGAEVLVRPHEQRKISSHQLVGCLVNAHGSIVTRFAAAPRERSPCPHTNTYQQFVTGIRAIDTLCAIAHGQRVAFLAEPGVGKSTLLHAIAKHSTADINIFALIGERRREVTELTHNYLSSTDWQKTIVIASTSDEAAAVRKRAFNTALTIAESFRDEGKRVLLIVDSLTRFVRALREVGLVAGEIPVRRGYPASVFAELPKYIERIGQNDHGSITALLSMLRTGELDEDPMVEEVLSLVDGHILLSKNLAEKGCYPAIDVSHSLSRLARHIQTKDVAAQCTVLRQTVRQITEYEEMRFFTNSTTEELSRILSRKSAIEDFLFQDVLKPSCLIESLRHLQRLAA